jgi:hypothetical protein
MATATVAAVTAAAAAGAVKGLSNNKF